MTFGEVKELRLKIQAAENEYAELTLRLQVLNAVVSDLAYTMVEAVEQLAQNQYTDIGDIKQVAGLADEAEHYRYLSDERGKR